MFQGFTNSAGQVVFNTTLPAAQDRHYFRALMFNQAGEIICVEDLGAEPIAASTNGLSFNPDGQLLITTKVRDTDQYTPGAFPTDQRGALWVGNESAIAYQYQGIGYDATGAIVGTGIGPTGSHIMDPVGTNGTTLRGYSQGNYGGLNPTALGDATIRDLYVSTTILTLQTVSGDAFGEANIRAWIQGFNGEINPFVLARQSTGLYNVNDSTDDRVSDLFTYLDGLVGDGIGWTIYEEGSDVLGLWNPTNVLGLSGSVVGVKTWNTAGQIFGPNGIARWQGVPSNGRRHRLRLRVKGATGSITIVGVPTENTIISTISLSEGGVIDEIIDIPAGDQGWEIRASTSVNAGSWENVILTDEGASSETFFRLLESEAGRRQLQADTSRRLLQQFAAAVAAQNEDDDG